MSQTTSNPAPPLAQAMLAALCQLMNEREQHECGGFAADDIQLQMRVAFTPEQELNTAFDALERAGLIRCAGTNEADEACFVTTGKGRELVALAKHHGAAAAEWRDGVLWLCGTAGFPARNPGSRTWTNQAPKQDWHPTMWTRDLLTAAGCTLLEKEGA